MASPSFHIAAPAAGIFPAPAYAIYHHPFPSQIDPNRPPPPPRPPIHGDPHVTPYAAAYPCSPDLGSPLALNFACGYSPAPATYQALPFSGGSHSFYSAPPAFPHAASYPNPPPTSVYTPASSFSPTPTTSQQWVASAPTAAPDPWVKQNGDIFSTKAASNNRSFMELSSPTSASDLPTPAVSHVSSPTKEQGLQQGATSGSPALHMFGEMPTLGTHVLAPGYVNSCCEYSNQSSCMQGGSTNHPENYANEVPQSYGFNNLISQSVSLADGTQRRYYALPEDYPLKQTSPPMSPSAREKVSVTAQPSVAAQAMPTAMQDASSVFKELSVYDVSEEDMTACRRCLCPAVHTIEIDTEELEVKVDSGKPTICLERPTDSIFRFANEKKSGTELLAVCFKNSSNNSFSDEVTDLAIQNGPIIDVDRSSNLPNEKSTQAAPILCDQETTVHCHDEKSEINIMKQDDERACSFLILKSSNTCATKSSSLLSIEHSMRELRLLWDPGASLLPHLCNGSAIIILQQLYNKDIYLMLEFLLEKRRQVQWDPGIKFILYELWWLSKSTTSAFRHLLVVKFGSHNYSYFTSYFTGTATYLCCPPANFIQQRRIIAALLHFLQYKLLSSVVEQATWHSQVASASYVWDTDTMLLLYKSRRLLLFTKEKETIPLIQWSFWFNDAHYCQIFQECREMSHLMYWHHDIKFGEIALWLITFNPP